MGTELKDKTIICDIYLEADCDKLNELSTNEFNRFWEKNCKSKSKIDALHDFRRHIINLLKTFNEKIKSISDDIDPIKLKIIKGYSIKLKSNIYWVNNNIWVEELLENINN